MFDLSNARFAFLDIETTGLSPWFGDRICQIAIVLTEGKRIKSTVDLLINPERTLSPAAFHINGLDESKLSDAPRFEEITEQLEALLKDAVIVCHNAKFDIQFLDNEYRKLGRSVEYPNLIDTLVLAREYFDLPSYSLHHLAEDFQVSTNMSGSRAQADAMTAKNIFFAMMDALKSNGKPLDDYIGIQPIFNESKVEQMEGRRLLQRMERAGFALTKDLAGKQGGQCASMSKGKI